jgi:hypothetical protein
LERFESALESGNINITIQISQMIMYGNFRTQIKVASGEMT